MERSILVAEDSPTQAEHVRLLLEAEGYRVEVVANGREGLERIQSAPPDLIISDVVMPNVDGYAFCRAVKSVERTRRIPFVLLTERNTPADFIRGLQDGADNFITKPFEDDYLRERVRRIFENLDLRRQGRLDVEVTLNAGGRQLAINADKQQIIELLFSTLEDLVRMNELLMERTRELSAANEQLGQEIGERRRAEAEAERATRAKSEFLANMSHELRTPLNAIIGFAQLLHDGKVGPVSAEQAEFLGDILTSSRYLLQLINDVLDLAKVESGRLEFRPEPVDLARLTDEVRAVLHAVAAGKRIRLETILHPALGPVVLDPAKLKQVLYNYVSNAIKFTPEHGRVTVRVAPEGPDAFRLEVEDTGIGIKPEDLGRLFVEFRQLDAGPAKRHEGTGLGLAVTKRLVEAQGGRVGVQSTPGQGSVFFAVLPRTARLAAVRPGANDAVPGPAGGSGARGPVDG